MDPCDKNLLRKSRGRTAYSEDWEGEQEEQRDETK